MTRSCSSTTAATCRSLWVSTPPTMRRVPSMTAIPQPPVDRASMASPGPNAWTGQSRDHEGQALLGSQASARQSLTARRFRAVDRSGERHGRSIRVRVRPHRTPCGASLARQVHRSEVRPPGNWRLSSDYRCGARACFPARAADHGELVPERPGRSWHAPSGSPASRRSGGQVIRARKIDDRAAHAGARSRRERSYWVGAGARASP